MGTQKSYWEENNVCRNGKRKIHLPSIFLFLSFRHQCCVCVWIIIDDSNFSFHSIFTDEVAWSSLAQNLRRFKWKFETKSWTELGLKEPDLFSLLFSRKRLWFNQSIWICIDVFSQFSQKRNEMQNGSINKKYVELFLI